MKIEKIKVPPLVGIPKPMKPLSASGFTRLMHALKKMVEETPKKIEGL